MLLSHRALLLGLSLFLVVSLNAQELRISDLVRICNQQDWTEVNQILMSKGWEYYSSDNNDDEGYSTITWSYNKSYNNESEAWFWLYVYENKPGGLIYKVFNRPSYDIINNNLKSAGFKIEDSDISSSGINSKYQSSSFYLEVSIANKEKGETYNKTTISTYTFDLIKKNSIFDSENGEKFETYDDGTSSRYTLKNGVIDGSSTSYHSNGKVNVKGSFRNGVKHGKFTEYNANGNKTAEYTVVNGKPHGIMRFFEDDRISIIQTKKNGIDHGKYIKYYYNRDGDLYLTYEGVVNEGLQEGRWSFYSIDGDSKEEVEFTTYKEGVENGPFEEYTSNDDTLIIGNYYNGKFDGKIIQKIKTIGYTTDGDNPGEPISFWLDDFEGYYKDGIKHGHWIDYTMFGKTSEGYYLNGKKEGKWTNYVLYGDFKSEVQRENHYENDILEGETRYYYMSADNKEFNDTSKVWGFFPIDVLNTYKAGELDGPSYAYDSLEVLLFKGSYTNGEKYGEWTESYLRNNYDSTSTRVYETGYYKEGERDGKWIQYTDRNRPIKEISYSLGDFHGELKVYTYSGNTEQVREYEYGDLKGIFIYDTTGLNISSEYHILNESQYSCLVKYSEFTDTMDISQVYEWNIKDRKDHVSDYWFDLQFQVKLAFPDDNSIIPSGERIVMDKIKNIRTEGRLNQDKRVGIWKIIYYESGIEEKIQYSDGKITSNLYYGYADGNITELFNGIFKKEDESGKLSEEISIKNGLRHGLTRFIDSNGEVVKKQKYKKGIAN